MNQLPTPILTDEDCAIWNALWGGCPLISGRQHYWSYLADGSITSDRRDAELMLYAQRYLPYCHTPTDRGAVLTRGLTSGVLPRCPACGRVLT